VSHGLLEAGRFVSFAGGEAALYAESVTPDRHLHGVRSAGTAAGLK
jgi:hypothetical protein